MYNKRRKKEKNSSKLTNAFFGNIMGRIRVLEVGFNPVYISLLMLELDLMLQ